MSDPICYTSSLQKNALFSVINKNFLSFLLKIKRDVLINITQFLHRIEIKIRSKFRRKNY